MLFHFFSQFSFFFIDFAGFYVENWTSADAMTFFFALHLIFRKIGLNMSFFSLFLVNMSFFFHFSQEIAIIFLNFFVDSWLDSPVLPSR